MNETCEKSVITQSTHTFLRAITRERRAMPKAMRGRPSKLDGSPRTEDWREKERARRQEQRKRKALGQSRPRGRPSKRGAAPEATKPDLVADQVAEPDNLSRSRRQS